MSLERRKMVIDGDKDAQLPKRSWGLSLAASFLALPVDN
jgi:hypothetical protein